MSPKPSESKPSKLTQVLINDLRGRRRVEHDFHSQNNKALEGRPLKQKKPEPKKIPWWRTAFGNWAMAAGVAILLMASIVVAVWQDIFQKSTITHIPQTTAQVLPPKSIKPVIHKKKIFHKI